MTGTPTVRELRVLITQYVDDSQPGWVECEFFDAAGQRWKIVEKVPIVTDQEISPTSELPRVTGLRCVEVGRRIDESGRELVTVNTEHPDGVEAVDGTNQFEVLANQIESVRIEPTTRDGHP